MRVLGLSAEGLGFGFFVLGLAFQGFSVLGFWGLTGFWGPGPRVLGT